MTKAKKVAAYYMTIVMFLSAVLHAYWALGGKWFLATATSGVDREWDASMVSDTWVLVAFMILASLLALERIDVVRLQIPQSLVAISLWVYTLAMCGGALINITMPGMWNNFVFCPIFLSLAAAGFALAIPLIRIQRFNNSHNQKRKGVCNEICI